MELPRHEDTHFLRSVYFDSRHSPTVRSPMAWLSLEQTLKAVCLSPTFPHPGLMTYPGVGVGQGRCHCHCYSHLADDETEA